MYIFFEIYRKETPSLSRHKFGSLYEENGPLYLKLNLQIRFIK
ncbi:MAG: HpaII family restriction endonuclease [Paludibacteraceae bacterium]|nr:HpaII family restriction endonuclease [Paludibacteraceae bacterium]